MEPHSVLQVAVVVVLLLAKAQKPKPIQQSPPNTARVTAKTFAEESFSTFGVLKVSIGGKDLFTQPSDKSPELSENEAASGRQREKRMMWLFPEEGVRM